MQYGLRASSIGESGYHGSRYDAWVIRYKEHEFEDDINDSLHLSSYSFPEVWTPDIESLTPRHCDMFCNDTLPVFECLFEIELVLAS